MHGLPRLAAIWGARPTAPFPSLCCSLLNSTNRRPIRAAFSFGRSMGNAGPALPGGWRKGLCSILPPDSSAERSFLRRMPMRPVIGIQAGEANAALLEGSGGLRRRRMAAAIPPAGKEASGSSANAVGCLNALMTDTSVTHDGEDLFHCADDGERRRIYRKIYKRWGKKEAANS